MGKSKRQVIQLLKSLYYNPKSPGSFSAGETLYRAAKDAGGNAITRKIVYDWLDGQSTHTLHRRPRKSFRRNVTLVNAIDEQWQIDLMDVSNIEKENKGFNFILVAIDILSKFVWCAPLKSKNATDTTNGFSKILKDAKPRKPLSVQSDFGTEFVNKTFQAFLKKEKIHYFNTQNFDTKASVVERVIQTLKHKLYKYFTFKNTLSYVNVLQDIVDSYNDTFHTSIKEKPRLVTIENENKIWHNLYDKTRLNEPAKFRFRVGDKVRLSKKKSLFAKGYATNFTKEIFVITKRIARSPPVYTIRDLKGEPIVGTIYASEMQLVKE